MYVIIVQISSLIHNFIFVLSISSENPLGENYKILYCIVIILYPWNVFTTLYVLLIAIF